MPHILNSPNECFGEPTDPRPCHGEVNLWTSTSGETGAYRCERHGQAYQERSEAIYRDVQSRFPGFDNPNSSPPEWFDPSYAGERWDDD